MNWPPKINSLLLWHWKNYDFAPKENWEFGGENVFLQDKLLYINLIRKINFIAPNLSAQNLYSCLPSPCGGLGPNLT